MANTRARTLATPTTSRVISSTRNSERIPEGRRGQVLTASAWNRVARVLNDDVLAGPLDLDGGVEADVVTKVHVLEEELRETEIVRVLSVQNPNLWLEVARFLVYQAIEEGNGDIWRFKFKNPPVPTPE